jgi:c-di-GMP-binding flagellar brake protein YcgR
MSVAPIVPLRFDKSSFERRSRYRFPLALSVEYKLLGKGERSGSGKTRNISSTGMLIEVPDFEPVSGAIELVVSWPCVLDGACALKLLMKGRVVRSEGKGIAIESRQHEFRTAGPVGGLKRWDSKVLPFNP